VRSEETIVVDWVEDSLEEGSLEVGSLGETSLTSPGFQEISLDFLEVLTETALSLRIPKIRQKEIQKGHQLRHSVVAEEVLSWA